MHNKKGFSTKTKTYAKKEKLMFEWNDLFLFFTYTKHIHITSIDFLHVCSHVLLYFHNFTDANEKKKWQ